MYIQNKALTTTCIQAAPNCSRKIFKIWIAEKQSGVSEYDRSSIDSAAIQLPERPGISITQLSMNMLYRISARDAVRWERKQFFVGLLTIRSIVLECGMQARDV